MTEIEDEKSELIRNLIHQEIVKKIIDQEWRNIDLQKSIATKSGDIPFDQVGDFEKGMITEAEILLRRLEKKFGIEKQNIMK